MSKKAKERAESCMYEVYYISSLVVNREIWL